MFFKSHCFHYLNSSTVIYNLRRKHGRRLKIPRQRNFHTDCFLPVNSPFLRPYRLAASSQSPPERGALLTHSLTGRTFTLFHFRCPRRAPDPTTSSTTDSPLQHALLFVSCLTTLPSALCVRTSTSC